MRIGLIGAGSIGQRHWANLRKLGYRDIVVWDNDPARRTVPNQDAFWSFGPEVVFICTPPDSHTHFGIRALVHCAKAIFIEKPLSTGMGPDEVFLIQKAKRLGVVTMCAANWRWAIPLRKFFAPGMNQHIRLAEFHVVIPGLKDALFDIAIHLVDLACWRFGPGQLRISAQSANAFTLLIDHEGAISSVRALTEGQAYSFKVMLGTRWESQWAWQWNGKDSRWPWGFKRNTMYIDELRHFMRCVETGQPTGNDLGQAAETLKLALGVA